MGELHIEIFQGYPYLESKKMIADVHVCDERGRTKKIFPAIFRDPRPNALSIRIDYAEDWIKDYQNG